MTFATGLCYFQFVVQLVPEIRLRESGAVAEEVAVQEAGEAAAVADKLAAMDDQRVREMEEGRKLPEGPRLSIRVLPRRVQELQLERQLQADDERAVSEAETAAAVASIREPVPQFRDETRPTEPPEEDANMDEDDTDVEDEQDQQPSSQDTRQPDKPAAQKTTGDEKGDAASPPLPKEAPEAKRARRPKTPPGGGPDDDDVDAATTTNKPRILRQRSENHPQTKGGATQEQDEEEGQQARG
jgi:hypothetical protein